VEAERRSTRGVEYRVAAKGPGTIVGYAAVFDSPSQDLGAFCEVIDRDAFDSVLGQDIRDLANHDPSMLLGRTAAGTLRLTIDRIGLLAEIALPSSAVGRDIAALIKRGDIDGMSFSFDVGAGTWDQVSNPPVRTIKRVAVLYDVGPVTYPAYAETSAAMRSLERSGHLLAAAWQRQLAAEAVRM
jgi:HK97 family phage prohead protease